MTTYLDAISDPLDPRRANLQPHGDAAVAQRGKGRKPGAKNLLPRATLAKLHDPELMDAAIAVLKANILEGDLGAVALLLRFTLRPPRPAPLSPIDGFPTDVRKALDADTCAAGASAVIAALGRGDIAPEDADRLLAALAKAAALSIAATAGAGADPAEVAASFAAAVQIAARSNAND